MGILNGGNKTQGGELIQGKESMGQSPWGTGWGMNDTPREIDWE